MPTPAVFIIIVNWNGLSDTLECLQSLYRLTYPSFTVVVVDNGSAVGEGAAIRRAFPQALVIENGKNLGFTGGNNVGIRTAMELEADYIWLLNNDTTVPPDALDILVEAGEKSPHVGLLSPVVHDYDTPERVQFMGAYFPAPGQERYVEDPTELQDERMSGQLVLFGTALLVKRGVVRSIGGLSDTYFAYYEDIDYCMRAIRSGFRTMVVVDAAILHKGVRSTGGRNSPVKAFLMARNAYFLWKGNGGGLLFPLRYLAMMITYAKYLADEGSAAAYDACLNGMYTAIRGRSGPPDPCLAAPRWLQGAVGFFVRQHPFFWISLLKGNISAIFLRILQKARPHELPQ